MILKIIWSPHALKDFSKNIEYLENRFSEKEVKHFIEKTEQIFSIIDKKPTTFKKVNYKHIHSVPVVSQITLYYKYDSNNIYLLRFWNNHKDVRKLKFK